MPKWYEQAADHASNGGMSRGEQFYLLQKVEALINAANMARHRLSELNGQVSPEVWKGNYDVCIALDQAVSNTDKGGNNAS